MLKTGQILEPADFFNELRLDRADSKKRNVKGSPRISVVIPVYNGERFIRQCLNSILNQNYPNTEILVIDGGSTDGTVDVVNEYKDHIAHIVSEKDRGQSDAINKGLLLSSGDLVGWQNADDVYLPGAFENISRLYRNSSQSDLLYCGKIIQIDEHNRVLWKLRSWTPTVKRIAVEGHIISSQGVFWRRCYQGFDNQLVESLTHSMDIELWLRLLKMGRARYTPAFLGAFRYYPGTKTAEFGQKGVVEFEQIIGQYGYNAASTGYKLKRSMYRGCRLLANFFSTIFQESASSIDSKRATN